MPQSFYEGNLIQPCVTSLNFLSGLAVDRSAWLLVAFTGEENLASAVDRSSVPTGDANFESKDLGLNLSSVTGKLYVVGPQHPYL